MKRRTFLAHAGALAGSAALGQLGFLAANAAPANDYKALVCVFLHGGNDANNMIVPLDTDGYANYATIRSYLALPQAQLLPLQVSAGAPLYGLHPALPGLQALWAAGNMAIVANVGTLVQPLTKAQYRSTSTIKPESLFSHIDQQHQWQASISSTILEQWLGWTAHRPARVVEFRLERAADDIDRRKQSLRHRCRLAGPRDTDEWIVRAKRILKQRDQ